jgi:hypothetical protein
VPGGFLQLRWASESHVCDLLSPSVPTNVTTRIQAQDSAANPTDWVQPTRLAAAWRACKVLAHVLLRSAKNWFHGPVRISPSGSAAEARIVAEHRSSLWLDGREDEFVLRCGKVQNLRVAVSHFDGVAVARGQVLSFWSQLGRPAKSKGYVAGREIVNGCVVPTVGGGLCQLSNALAEVAATAGIRLIERHRHSALIEQQRQNEYVDATVAWNYIDLRLQADFDFSVEAQLTHDELVVRLRSATAPSRQRRYPISQSTEEQARPTARGCLTCDQTACFRNRRYTAQPAARTALLLNERSPELAAWLQEREGPHDWFLPWVRPKRRHLGWSAPKLAQVSIALLPGWKRVLRQRLTRGEGAARQAGRSRAAADLAQHYADRLRPEHINLVVTQELLVPLWRIGALGGRSFDVFMCELPASELQARLDEAARDKPEAASLRDFRVDSHWQKDEWAALAAARTVISPHSEVQRVLQQAGIKVECLPWYSPAPLRGHSGRSGRVPTVVFPASALPRKGALEVAEVARRLAVRVLVLGTPPSDVETWAGVNWSAVPYSSDWLSEADVVLLPAYIEHQPRAALQAIAAGIPVVASPACGLKSMSGVQEVQAGDVDAIERAVTLALAGVRAEPNPPLT